MSDLKFKAIDGGTTSVDEAALAKLGAGLRGEVLTRGTPGYDEARTVWNAMIDRKPGIIVRCQGAADVCQAVRFAADNRLLVAVRGGGHNISGNAVCDGGLMRQDSAIMRPPGNAYSGPTGCPWVDERLSAIIQPRLKRTP